MRRKPEFFECPNCGASVRVGAKVCRECGSDDTTGWQSSEAIDYQSIEIPDGYGPENELEQERGRSWLVPIVAALLAVAMAAWALRVF